MLPSRFDTLRDYLDRARFWFEGLTPVQKALTVVVGIIAMFLLLHVFAVGLVLLLAGIVVLLALAWFEDVVWLMRQPDSVFPGRYDKPIWAALLFFLPPVGMLALWSFRRSMQPTTSAKPEPASWRDWV